MKHYFLFGSGIINALNNGGICAACKYARNESDWGVFCFDTEEMEPHELLLVYNDWSTIEEKEYKKLIKL
jgi:hypothetical protein